MILVTGSKGQLGTELGHLLDERKIAYLAADRNELDITNKEQVMAYFESRKPSIVFHCAAYTAVDKAELEEQEANYLVNEIGTHNIASACKELGSKLIYISTDYVFDGQLREKPYKEDDKVSPINEYGKAKLKGEEAVQNLLDTYYIIRTSWVFGAYGPNFVYTMERLAENHSTLTVVNDQYGRPTWTRSLAEFMLYLVDQECAYGVYHFSNDDSCTWYEFASDILKDKHVEIKPVDSSQFPQVAKRPAYSMMDLDKAKETGFEIISWKKALHLFLESKS